MVKLIPMNPSAINYELIMCKTKRYLNDVLHAHKASHDPME